MSGVRLRMTRSGACGVHRSQAKDHQHEDRHNQRQQHGAAAREITHFFFKHRRDGLRKSGQIPSHLQALYLRDGGTCRDLAEILTAKLRAQANVQQKSNGSSQRRKQEQGSEASQKLSRATVCAIEPAASPAAEGLHLSGDLCRLAQLRMWPFPNAPWHGPDQLKAQHRQDEKHAHDFAGAALRQPALEPGEDRLHQDQIEEREGQQHQQRPGKQKRRATVDADQNSQECDLRARWPDRKIRRPGESENKNGR